jgi:phosphoribosylanthranilate isomerase
MPIDVKICGLTTAEAVKAAVEAGTDYVGFVFYGASPRCILPGRAASLAVMVPDEVIKVGLVVDADDTTLESILRKVPLDMLQLHGDESPERVEEVKANFDVKVIKAVALSEADDLSRARIYEHSADMLLFDAMPPREADRPGGNALSFDWNLLGGESWAVPWLLAGGLDAENLETAVRASGAEAVDVSSGVESTPGVKDPEKIRRFLAKAAGI